MNRREFLRTSAGALCVASAGRVLGAGAASNRVRLAIVGCHEQGRGIWVMKAALKVPGVEIACVCDVDRRAREFAADYVLKATGVKPKMEKDLRIVLEDASIDGIISETPDHFHAWSAVMAMRAGKAVYVEKPCCFCPAEGQILMRTAKETGQVLQVGSQRRASLSYRAALDWVRSSGVLGDLRYAKAWYHSDRASIGVGKKCAVPEWLDWDLWQACAPREDFRDNIVHYNWHWFRNWGTSEMGNNAPHFADVSRWMLGLDTFPETVQCGGGSCLPKGGDFQWPDVFHSTFKYPNGKVIAFEMTCHGCSRAPFGVHTGAIVYGQKGSMFLGPGDNAIILDDRNKVIREWAAGGIEKNKMQSLTDPTASLDVRHMANFVECIRAKNPKTYASTDEGVKSSVLPLLANIAIDCGETLHVDPVTGNPTSRVGADKWAREYAKGWELV